MHRLNLLALSLLCLCAVGLAAAQPPEMPKPGPEHAYLKKVAGDWDCVMKMMGMEMKCTHKCEMLGEFWVVGKFSGDFGGMKFEGRDSCGWDPLKKKYTATWIDSMSPHGMTMLGDYDAGSKTMTMEGMGVNEQNKPAKFKEVITWKSDDEYSFTMHEEKNGKMEQIFTIDYKRKK